MRIVLLMFLVVVLVALFGNVLSYFVTLATAGYSWLISALTIPLDFFSRVLVSMFQFGYIRTILSVFLAIELTFFLISALKGDVKSGFADGVEEAEAEEQAIIKKQNKIGKKKGIAVMYRPGNLDIPVGVSKKIKPRSVNGKKLY